MDRTRTRPRPSDVPLVLTVSGHGELALAPERCTIDLAIAAESPDRTEAVDEADRAARRVVDLVRAWGEDTVASWSVGQVRRSRFHRHHGDGTPGAWVHRAETDATVVFREFDAIGDFVDALADAEAVEIGRMSWDVTAETRLARQDEVRAAAVSDAATKAATYARAVGRGTPVAVAVADPGLIDAPTPAFPVARAAMSADAGSVGLRPDDIVVTSDVHVRFEAP